MEISTRFSHAFALCRLSSFAGSRVHRSIMATKTTKWSSEMENYAKTDLCLNNWNGLQLNGAQIYDSQ